LDSASIAGLLPVVLLLPVAILCFLPVALLIGAATRLQPALVVVLWIAASGLMFVPAVEQVLLRRLFDAREPSPEELRILDPCWQAVLGQARVSGDRYILAVQDSEELNAAATGGHIVIVTTRAIATLPQDELRGVLAHELGHHLGLHAVSLMVGYWLSVPIVWCSRLSYRMSRIAAWFTGLFEEMRLPTAANIGILIALEFRLFAFLLRIFTRIANALGRLIGQQAEYHADHTATALGFGVELEQALQRLLDLDLDGRANTNAAQRLFSTHPPLSARIRRVQQQLAVTAAASARPAGSAVPSSPPAAARDKVAGPPIAAAIPSSAAAAEPLAAPRRNPARRPSPAVEAERPLPARLARPASVRAVFQLQGTGLVAVGIGIGLLLAAVVTFSVRAMHDHGARQPAGSSVAIAAETTAQAADATSPASQETTATQQPPATVGAAPTELTGAATAFASATAPDNVDDAGNPTSYAAANVLDDDAATAWRVKGDGRGVTVTLTLPSTRHLVRVGLIPGYAKTDLKSGTNRFYQERRVGEVRWRFDDGSVADQVFTDTPTMQTTTVDVTTRSITIEIVATRPGDLHYDYTPISDVSLMGSIA
jgi:heat shock protein HtpX/STE24 endopeptidase